MRGTCCVERVIALLGAQTFPTLTFNSCPLYVTIPLKATISLPLSLGNMNACVNILL